MPSSTGDFPWQEGIVVVGTRHNTAEFIDRLLFEGKTLSGIVTISERVAESNRVPTWVDLKAMFGDRIPTYVAKSYGLRNDDDIQALKRTRAMLGLCVGWQRLIPDWYLDTFERGVFGQHPSQFPLPRGRGRSPGVWALIDDAASMYAHVFQYTPGVDDGGILDDPLLELDAFDTIDTLQQKARVLFTNVVLEHWDDLVSGQFALRPQAGREIDLEYPKRTPDDGGINWAWSRKQIFNWVRAQTRPYPGAFCHYRGARYAIWQAVPFIPLGRPLPPAGTIAERFHDGSYVVAAGDGYLHVRDHDLPTDIKLGEVLENGC